MYSSPLTVNQSVRRLIVNSFVVIPLERGYICKAIILNILFAMPTRVTNDINK